MSDSYDPHLLSLKDICRCCHSDGNFKSLKEPYKFRGKVEVYYKMLIETFGLLVSPPEIEASYTICDDCIVRLRDSTKFKDQVEACEQKFNLYYSQLLQNTELIRDDEIVTVDEVKKENNSVEIVTDNDVNIADEIVNVDDELKKENSSYDIVNDNIINIDDEIVNIDDELKKENSSYDIVNDNIINIDDEIVNIDDELKKENNSYDIVNDNIINIYDEVVNIDDEFKKENNSYDIVNDNIINIYDEVVNIDDELKKENNSYDIVNDNIINIDDEIVNVDDDLKKENNSVETVSDHTVTIDDHIVNADAEYELENQSVNNVPDKTDNIYNDMVNVIDELKTENNTIENLDDNYDGDVENVSDDLNSGNVTVTKEKELNNDNRERNINDEDSALDNIDNKLLNVDETDDIDDEIENVEYGPNKANLNLENVVDKNKTQGVTKTVAKRQYNLRRGAVKERTVQNLAKFSLDYRKNCKKNLNVVVCTTKLPKKRKLKNKIKCVFCEKKCISKDFLKIHILEHMNDNYECNYCTKYYKNLSSIKSHCKTVHSKPWDIDKDVNTDTGLLKKHSNLKNINTFGCAFCLKTFVSKDLLKIHIKEHMKKKCKCDDCGRSFLNRGNLKVHCKKKHNKVISFADDKNKKTAKRMKMICRFCKKVVSEYTYEAHLKKHVGETECIRCSKIFASKKLLNDHFKTHPEAKFTCDYCGQQFRLKSGLAFHISIHMGSKERYKCTDCGQLFTRINVLKTHSCTID